MVGISNQYSDPVCTGRCIDTYATIKNTWEISRENQLLTQEHYVGIQEFAGTGYCVDNMQTTWTDESQMMTSHGSRTSQLHKRIAQNDRAKQDDVTSRNGNDE